MLEQFLEVLCSAVGIHALQDMLYFGHVSLVDPHVVLINACLSLELLVELSHEIHHLKDLAIFLGTLRAASRSKIILLKRLQLIDELLLGPFFVFLLLSSLPLELCFAWSARDLTRVMVALPDEDVLCVEEPDEAVVILHELGLHLQDLESTNPLQVLGDDVALLERVVGVVFALEQIVIAREVRVRVVDGVGRVLFVKRRHEVDEQRRAATGLRLDRRLNDFNLLPPSVPWRVTLDLCAEFVVLEDADERDDLVLGTSVSDEGAELLGVLVRLVALDGSSGAAVLVACWVCTVLESSA